MLLCRGASKHENKDIKKMKSKKATLTTTMLIVIAVVLFLIMSYYIHSRVEGAILG